MTGIPGENNPESGDVGGHEQARQPLKDELKSSLAWLEHAALAGGDLVRLVGLELRLAIADSGKLAVLGLAMVPLLLLAWIGLSVLLGWLAFAWSGSVALSIVVFIVVQLATLGVMAALCKKYAKSLSFPATKRQLQTLKEETSGTKETEKSDSTAR
ncbi:hypothetical protein SAMN05216198_2690 [Halopseudomonas litoralis]|uniref:Holin-X, holin superfamily III n=1 Tax=Halopseudomonas litoralis TaxID=797277 RepID=A0A1H1URQ5_9GAMM|nr:phage holin family protein [Halopseudomonas litoralis]SDS75268.1 hypothetical protein SAMN05216198_2690 [Halopseudomonas litoralis]